MKRALILILCLLPSCQSMRDRKMARAINENIEKTDQWLRHPAPVP